LLFRDMKIQGIVKITGIIFKLSFLLATLPTSGQSGNILNGKSVNDLPDQSISSLISRQADYINNRYSEKIEAPKELINGKEYELYHVRSKVKPLFLADKEHTGSLITKTRRYNNLNLQYDTFLDEVVYTDTSRLINFRFPQIALNKNIIEGFEFNLRDKKISFKYFREPECSELNLEEGFYEVVYEEKSHYIIKHESSYYERQGLNNYKYSAINYISVGNKFFKIKTSKDLSSLVGDKSDDIKEFLQFSGLKVRNADKAQMLRILKFYDNLQ